MPDEQTETSQSAPSGVRFKGRLTKGCRTLVAALAVVLVVISGFVYWVLATLNPDIGLGGLQARTVAYSASHHLYWSSAVKSAKVSRAYADPTSGPIAQVDARLKDETSVDQAAELLASTHRKADSSQVPLSATLSWKLNGSDITVNFSCDDSPDNIHAQIRRDLSPVGEAKTITRSEPDGSIKADYGTVSTVPSSITDPIGPESSQTFTLNGWQVTSTSNKNGQFANTPLEPVITAASQASTTGTIDLDGDTLSVTGLVADENKGLTLEAAAPVVHAVSDCRIAGLNTLQLNGKVQRGLSSDNDYWLSFTCKDGTWTPQHGGNTGHDEAAILQKAAEL